MSVGRISGPLLKSNLERNGIDLYFANTISDTALLYVDVNTGRIGVNTNTPTDTIEIAGTARGQFLLIETEADIGNLHIEDNTISTLVGPINLNASTAIKLSNFETDNIHISDNSISTYRSNANIDIVPNGTGTVEVLSNLEVLANLHATGSITADGSVTIGDNANDSITLNADIATDIIPDQTQTYDLGRQGKRWKDFYTNLVNGSGLVASELIATGGADYHVRQGNIFFVSVNGSDTNGGDNVQSPFATLKHALSAVDASIQGPVAIYVFPGEYEEQFPLTVPSNVSVIGEDIRNTIIKPTAGTNTNTAFLLNGESTIQHLTIKDFYAPGYAFEFASNATITSRSPYIQNITVITKGSVTSASDPRGFDSGDAGGGAYIDGASVNSLSNEASMLFHSATFITPGVDAITMTNGVRVEWLNSFTYFANRGLYAVDGVTGHLSTDGSTVKYGAEIRSIGSANVYGNYGAVADGADTLMYLIQHNFAYIGLGKYVDNDPSRVIQSQEVTKLNSGRIYYQSIDHLGNFRVGDQFFVDQESGNTSIVITEAQVDALNGLTITTNGNTTYVDGERIETGNIKLSGNTIEALAGSMFFTSSNNNINLQNNTNISGYLTMTGDFTIGGSVITLGNEPGDTVDFNTPFSQDLEPDISGLYNLGSTSKRWSKSWLSQAEIADIKIQDNVITTTESNTDLEIRANGTGRIYLPDNDLEIGNNLTVNSNTFLNGVSYTAFNINLTLTLDNPNAYGTSADDLFASSVAISGNYAIVGASREDEAGFTGSSSGKAYIFDVATGSLVHTLDNPNAYGTSDSDQFGQSVAISGNYAIVGTWREDDAGGVNVGKAYIFDVTTGALLHTLDNPNAYGTSDSDSFGRSLAISGNYAIVGAPYEDDSGGSNSGKAYIFDVTTGTLLHTLDNPNAYGTSANDNFGDSVAISGNYAIVGAYGEDDAGGTSSGKAYIFNVTTGALVHTLDNPNAYGTSFIDFFGGEVAIDGNYAIVSAAPEDDAGGDASGKVYIFDVTTGSLLHTLDNPNAYGTSADDWFGQSVAISGNYVIVGTYREDDAGGLTSGKVYIFDVTTGTLLHTLDNPNAYGTSAGDSFGRSVAISGNRAIVGAYFEADAGGSGSGKAYIFQLTDPTTVITPTDVNITGTVIQTGDTTISNDLNVTGAAHITGLLDVGAKAQLENILIDGNLITTTASNSDLDLRANGSGRIIFDEDLHILNNLQVRDVLSSDSIILEGTVAIENISASADIDIFDNVVTTTLSNSDLELRANGTGSVALEDILTADENLYTTTQSLELSTDSNVVISSTSAIQLPVGNSAERVLTAGNLRFSSGIFEGYAGSVINFGGVYSSNRLTSVTADPTSNAIRMIVNGTVDPLDSTDLAGEVISTGITLQGLQVDDVNFNSNLISTTVSNSDLELRRNGTGEIVIGNLSFFGQTINNNDPAGGLTIASTGEGYVKFGGTGAVLFPAGDNNQKGSNNQIGDTRYNTTEKYMEVFDGTNWIVAAGGGESVTSEFMEDLSNEWTLILG